MTRNHLSAFVLTVVCFGRAALAEQPSAVIISNSAQNPGVIAVAGTANVAGSVSINNTPSVNVANSPAVQQAGFWTVDLNPNAQVNATLSPGASVQVSSLPPVSLAPNQAVAVSSLPAVALSGTPSVTISGTPTVTVANLPGAGERFGVVVSAGDYTDPVPSGKRLILTHVSSHVIVPTGHTAQMKFYLPTFIGNEQGPILSVPLLPDGVIGIQALGIGAHFISSEKIDVILEAGESAWCTANDTSGNNVGVSGSCSYFGRLVDAQ